MQHLFDSFTKALVVLCLFIVSSPFSGHLYAQNVAPGSAYLKNMEDALCIVRVDYLLYLKDPKDPQSYGSEGHDYFGRAAGLAFVSDGRLWFDERLTKPWQNFDQANYDRYKKDTMLEPRVSQVAIRRVSGKKFVKLADDFKGIEPGQVSTLKLPDSLQKPMMYNLQGIRDTNGLLVIATLDKGEDLNDENVKITLTSTQPTRGCVVEKDKDDWSFSGGITGVFANLGGIWLVYKDYPQGDGLRGIYALKAAGIGKRAALNWQIMPLPERQTEGKRADLNTVKQKPATPAASDDEKKKSGKNATGKSSTKGNKNNPDVKIKPIEDRKNNDKPRH